MATEEKNINIEGEDLEKQPEMDNEAQQNANAEDKEQNGTEAKAEDNAEPQPTEPDPVETLKQENEKLKDQLLRQMAEFDNYKKRTLKEKAELILNGGERTVVAILPVLDDFERALADKSEDPKAIKEGVQMIYHKFIKSLETLGVKKIETEGKDFDVDFHEAVAMVPGMGDDKKGKVIDCMQTGYMMNERVIRHAKVAVGQ